MRVARVGVAGAREAGPRLAEAIASAGVPVLLTDPDQGLLEAGRERVAEIAAARLTRLAERGTIAPADVEAGVTELLDRVRPAPGYAGFGEVDVAVDAGEGDSATVLAELDALTPGRAILAVASPSAPVSELAAATSRPDRVLGLNLAYSEPGARLLEIARGERTSAAVLAAAFGFAQGVRLAPIVCADAPGRVVARLRRAAGRAEPGEPAQLAALVEACALVQEGGCTLREVDQAVAADPGRVLAPPFADADRVGLDVIVERLGSLRDGRGDNFSPPILVRRLVSQGRIGAAAGQGFYPHPRPDPGPQPGTVKVETRGPIAILWLANDPVNAISRAVADDLGAAWDRVRAGGARAVVVASSSPLVFSAGGDLKAFKELDDDAGTALIDRIHDVFERLWTGGTPTVAAVNGLALGGGCELGMACDFRLAASSAYFSLPEAGLGTAPSFGATVRLPRLVGESGALEMIAMGRVVLAGEARALGLVNAVVPDHELFDEALAWAGELAAQPPLAVAHMKRILRKGDVEREIAAEKEGFSKLVRSEDAREGLAAFLERREPVWKGR